MHMQYVYKIYHAYILIEADSAFFFKIICLTFLKCQNVKKCCCYLMSQGK